MSAIQLSDLLLVQEKFRDVEDVASKGLKEEQDPQFRSRLYSNLADAHLYQDQLHKAQIAVTQAFLAPRDPIANVQIYLTQTKIFIEKKNFIEAEIWAKAGVRMTEKDPENQAEFYYCLSCALLQQNKLQEGKEAAEKGLLLQTKDRTLNSFLCESLACAIDRLNDSKMDLIEAAKKGLEFKGRDSIINGRLYYHLSKGYTHFGLNEQAANCSIKGLQLVNPKLAKSFLV